MEVSNFFFFFFFLLFVFITLGTILTFLFFFFFRDGLPRRGLDLEFRNGGKFFILFLFFCCFFTLGTILTFLYFLFFCELAQAIQAEPLSAPGFLAQLITGSSFASQAYYWLKLFEPA